MIIAGIDPGIARVGWSIIQSSTNNFSLIAAGLFETLQTEEITTRLEKIHHFAIDLLEKYQPDVVAVEELFFTTNAKTVFKVGQARGAILLSASEKGLEVISYTPLQVKQALTGYGKADKKQIQSMVKSILKLPRPILQDDTADAVAIALTHAFSYKMQNQIRACQ